MDTNLEDDWENTEIPDLLVTLKNKERELKLLEERKLIEEDGNALIEELFDEDKNNKRKANNLSLIEQKKCIKSVKEKDNKKVSNISHEMKQKKSKILQEERQQQIKFLKEQKQQIKRLNEIYGEAEPDEHYEKYKSIIDKYY